VVLDGLARDEQLGGHLRVRPPLGHELRDPQLAAGELVGQRPACAFDGLAREP